MTSQLLGRFAEQRILVLGDLVADEYVIGRPARISREAPVLILHHTSTFVRPGGATNPAYNLSRLGAQTAIVGVVGDDEWGRRLRGILTDAHIDTSGLLIDGNRPTSTKTRILGKGVQEVQQQIVRVDRIDDAPLEPAIRDQMIDLLMLQVRTMDALLISDYENGVISSEVLDACLPEARKYGVKIIVDSHGDLFRFKGVTAATPNQPEAAGTLREAIPDDAALDRAGSELLAGMDAEGILITRGSEGIALFERGRPPYKLPVTLTHETQLVDPTGAGDTVAAVFTLALASGASMRMAAFLGNIAGGHVVRQLGAATLSIGELELAVKSSNSEMPECPPH